MGLIDNLEQGLEKAVRGVFAAGSKNRIEPVDLASRLRAEMDKKSYTIAEGRTLAPNVFTIEFSEEDFPRAQDWGQPLAEELCDVAIRHARSQGYTLRGAVRVTFVEEEGDELRRGEFLILSAQARSGASPSQPETRRGQNQSPLARQASNHAPAPGDAARRDVAESAPAAAGAGAGGALASGSSAPAPTAWQDRPSPSRPAPSPQQRPTPPRETPAREQRLAEPARRDDARPAPGHRSPAAPAPRPSTAELKPVLDVNGQRFSLRASSVVLGRSSEADITVDDTGVSRRHVEILNQDGVFLAVDLGSTNGSFVDGTRLNGRRQLVDGSVITMGRTKITFRLLAPRRSSSWHQS